MSREIRTRYAPSPTGYMHIGNLRTALYEYLIAKKNNGKFILRIEDTDQERFVADAVEVIYRSLKTANLSHDEGPDCGGSYGPYVQSMRKSIYIEYAKKLVALGGAYYCFCSREKLQADKAEFEKAGKVYKYDGHCTSLSQAEIDANLSDKIPFVIRQKMPQSGQTSFEDAVYGTITVDNSELEDQVLIKSDGMPTYNFANVVDDHLMQITHVVRGNEYLSSTPKYNLLYKAFGWDIPVYIHVSMIVDSEGHKLSKRSGSASFEDLLQKGYLVDTVLNFIALLGWSPGTTQEIFTLAELVDAFEIKGISKSPAVFDVNKLNWMNGEYIRRMTPEKFHEVALPHYSKELIASGVDLKRLSRLLQQRTEVLTEISPKVDFFAQLPDYNTNLYIHKKSKTDEAISLTSLKAVIPVLEKLENWSNESIYNCLSELAASLEIKNSQLLWPVRTALSGKEVTPGGATEIAEILGREESLKRLKIGISKLS